MAGEDYRTVGQDTLPTDEVSSVTARSMNATFTNFMLRSWYMGDNVPGKVREQLNFAGGFPLYKELTRSALDDGFRGFITA